MLNLDTSSPVVILLIYINRYHAEISGGLGPTAGKVISKYSVQ